MRLPRWIGRFVPWRLLYWLDRRTAVCWPDVVSWKIYGEECDDASFAPWACIGREQDGRIMEGACYCGKFAVQNGVCYRRDLRADRLLRADPLVGSIKDEEAPF
jgi:hypothetical protein